MTRPDLRRVRARVAPALARAASDAAAGLGLYRLAGAHLAGVGVILTLHHVVEPGARLMWPGFEIPADTLDTILGRIRRSGWEVVTLDELRRRLVEGTPRRFVCFTCDDGYEDNLRLALPVFRAHGVPFTVYAATGIIERAVFYWWGGLDALVRGRDEVVWEVPGAAPERLPTRTWEEKQRAYQALSDRCHAAGPEGARLLLERYRVDCGALLDRDALTIAQVRALAAEPGVTVGSHGASHQRLAVLDEAAALADLREGMATLERWTGGPVRHLAYPFGSPGACGAREFELAARAGYATAVTTRRGNLFPEQRDHLMALPRREVPLQRVKLRNVLSGVEAVLQRTPRLRLS